MQTNVIPTSAPGDRAPKMTNQHTKLDQAMPVRTEASALSLLEPRAARSTARCPHSKVTSARAPVPSPNKAARIHLLPA
eukprot:scaffold80101_cov63-Phaeocystis_antarctica.AAC.1